MLRQDILIDHDLFMQKSFDAIDELINKYSYEEKHSIVYYSTLSYFVMAACWPTHALYRAMPDLTDFELVYITALYNEYLFDSCGKTINSKHGHDSGWISLDTSCPKLKSHFEKANLTRLSRYLVNPKLSRTSFI